MVPSRWRDGRPKWFPPTLSVCVCVSHDGVFDSCTGLLDLVSRQLHHFRLKFAITGWIIRKFPLTRLQTFLAIISHQPPQELLLVLWFLCKRWNSLQLVCVCVCGPYVTHHRGSLCLEGPNSWLRVVLHTGCNWQGHKFATLTREDEFKKCCDSFLSFFERFTERTWFSWMSKIRFYK